MTQSGIQNQNRQVRRSNLKAYQLKNNWFELTFFPEYGCIWQSLRISLEGVWIDLLKPLFVDMPPFHFGSYIMAPWSNRIAQGVFQFEGKRYELRKNFPGDTAIHGDVRSRLWQIRSANQEEFQASLDSRWFPDFNFPFPLVFDHALQLRKSILRMNLSVQNIGK